VEPPVCSAGLWGWSRHPNLFFELAFQWSVYAIVRPAEAPWVVLCPALLTAVILFFPGGVVALDMQRSHTYALYPSYVRYVRSVPALVPLPAAKGGLEACSPAAGALACCDVGMEDV
jgi:steroid 5-alpha reductase family enzyme